MIEGLEWGILAMLKMGVELSGRFCDSTRQVRVYEQMRCAERWRGARSHVQG